MKQALTAKLAWALAITMVVAIVGGVDATRQTFQVSRQHVTPRGRDLESIKARHIEHGRDLSVLEEEPIYGPFSSLAYFYLNVFMGNPPQRFSVIADTGSSLLAVPCSSCSVCGRHMNPKYDIAKSSSARYLPCTTSAVHCSTCSSSKCAYVQSYAEGSSLRGVYIEDELWVGSTTSTAQIGHEVGTRYPFGCHTSENGLFKTQAADGIMGLSRSTSTFIHAISAAGKLDKHMFSMCLHPTKGGVFNLGDYDTRLHSKEVQWSPVQGTGTFWKVKLLNVKVQDFAPLTDASANSGQGTIVDSGTSFGYLPHTMFTHVVSNLKSFCAKSGNCHGTQKAVNGEQLCYHLADEADIHTFPHLEIALQGATLIVPPQALFLELSWHPTHRCLSVYDNSGFSGAVVGATSMMFQDVIFDVAGRRVGFAPSSCTSPDEFGTANDGSEDGSSSSSGSASSASGDDGSASEAGSSASGSTSGDDGSASEAGSSASGSTSGDDGSASEAGSSASGSTSGDDGSASEAGSSASGSTSGDDGSASEAGSSAYGSTSGEQSNASGSASDSGSSGVGSDGSSGSGSMTTGSGSASSSGSSSGSQSSEGSHDSASSSGDGSNPDVSGLDHGGSQTSGTTDASNPGHIIQPPGTQDSDTRMDDFLAGVAATLAGTILLMAACVVTMRIRAARRRRGFQSLPQPRSMIDIEAQNIAFDEEEDIVNATDSDSDVGSGSDASDAEASLGPPPSYHSAYDSGEESEGSHKPTPMKSNHMLQPDASLQLAEFDDVWAALRTTDVFRLTFAQDDVMSAVHEVLENQVGMAQVSIDVGKCYYAGTSAGGLRVLMQVTDVGNREASFVVKSSGTSEQLDAIVGAFKRLCE